MVTMNKAIFKLVLMDEAADFLRSIPTPARDKMAYNIHRIQQGERNHEIFKKWEFRTLYNKTAYRLFAFWDKDEETLVIATHGLIKKTQKTPTKEIAKAERIRAEHFTLKK